MSGDGDDCEEKSLYNSLPLRFFLQIMFLVQVLRCCLRLAAAGSMAFCEEDGTATSRCLNVLVRVHVIEALVIPVIGEEMGNDETIVVVEEVVQDEDQQ